MLVQTLEDRDAYSRHFIGQFEEVSPSLEDLNLAGAGLTSLDSNAFRHIPSVSILDVSDNDIHTVEEEAFREVGNALRSVGTHDILLNKLLFKANQSKFGMQSSMYRIFVLTERLGSN